MAVVFQTRGETAEYNASENLIEKKEYSSSEGAINVPFGETEDGELIFNDLSELSHIMVFGQTGSGKTSFVRTLLSMILSENTLKDVSILIYDSIRVDYMQFKNVPHLLRPIMTEHNEVVSEIKNQLDYANKRLEHIAKHGCKDIKSYNSIRSEEEIKLPHTFFVLDDFALLQLDNEEMEDLLYLCRIGKNSGMHIILVSSVFSKKRNMLNLKSAIPCHICFRVSTRANSVDAIGSEGAEILSVPGEMIYKNESQCCKCQCVYSTYENIGTVMRSVSHEKASISSLGIEASMLFSDINITIDNSNDNEIEYDSYISDVARLVFESGKGSIGHIQRNLKLGFNRVARIFDQLEEMGVVGPEEGTKPRAVIMSVEEWNKKCETNGLEKIYGISDKSLDVNKDDKEDIELRDVEDFNVGEATIGVSDNKIHLKKPIMTMYGKGTAEPIFPGSSLSGIVYKKPTLFSKGYIMFEFLPSVNINNQNPELLHADKSDASELCKVEFGSGQDKMIRMFIEQLSEDIGVPIKHK